MNPKQLLLLLIMEAGSNFYQLSSARKINECAGTETTISCETTEKILVENEYYGYKKNSNTCDINSDFECIKRLILVTEAGSHCNGKSSCYYTVPSNIQLSHCKSNSGPADVTEVHYSCIPSQKILDVCQSISLTSKTVYLISPGYPNGMQNLVNCHCAASGTNMRIMILEISSFGNSEVILNIFGNGKQNQINYVERVFEIIFSNVSSAEIDLARTGNTTDLSKFWLRIDSDSDSDSNITVRCGLLQTSPSTKNTEATTLSNMLTQKPVTGNKFPSTHGNPSTGVPSTVTEVTDVFETSIPTTQGVTISTGVSLRSNASTPGVSAGINASTPGVSVSINKTSTSVTVNINPSTNSVNTVTKPTSNLTTAAKPSDGTTPTAVNSSVSVGTAAMRRKDVDEVGLYVGISIAVVAVLAIIILTVVFLRRKPSDKPQQQQSTVHTGPQKQDSEDVYTTVDKTSRKRKKSNSEEKSTPELPPKTELAYHVAETTDLDDNSVVESTRTSSLHQYDNGEQYCTVNIVKDSENPSTKNKSTKPGKYVVRISVGNGDGGTIMATENPCYESYNKSTFSNIDSNSNDELATENPCYESYNGKTIKKNDISINNEMVTENPCYQSYNGRSIKKNDISINNEMVTENPCYQSYNGRSIQHNNDIEILHL